MSNKYRFPAEISVSSGEILEVVTSTKILGIIISDDLKWTKKLIKQWPKQGNDYGPRENYPKWDLIANLFLISM